MKHNEPSARRRVRRSRRLSAEIQAALDRARKPIDLSQWSAASIAHLLHDVEHGTLTPHGARIIHTAYAGEVAE